MCLAVPALITGINGKTGIAEIMGVTREIALDLLSDPEIGDYVIVHAGCAIEKIDKEAALEMLSLFREIEGLR